MSPGGSSLAFLSVPGYMVKAAETQLKEKRNFCLAKGATEDQSGCRLQRITVHGVAKGFVHNVQGTPTKQQ